MKGKIAIMLASVMLLSIFSYTFALAESEQEVNDLSEISQDKIENSDLNDFISLDKNNLPGYRRMGLGKVTYSQGYAIKEDKGYLLNGLWATFMHSKTSTEDIKDLREKYKNDSKALKESLKNVSNETFVKISAGRIKIGYGQDSENFKIEKSNDTSSDLVFDVYSINSLGNQGRDKVGTLTLEQKNYSDMTLYEGELVISSGDFEGSYDVSLASKTNSVKSFEKNSGFLDNKKGPENAEKKGFWKRMIFWKN